ncbi:MAG: hypothetical protein K9G62_03900 [Alphaproteobacteria bacterium]|nr:hypothetical protein [Alphaproteobacteria bacterium]
MALQALLAVFTASAAAWAAETAHNAAHGESAGGLPQLDPTWFASQVFWLMLVFIGLYALFSLKILPALGGTIEMRRARVEGDIEEAQSLKEEAEKIQAAYESGLAEARTRASLLMQDTENRIRDETAARLGAFRDRSLKDIQATELRINASKTKALKDMESIAAELAAQAAEQIAGIPADVKQARSVIENMTKKAA